MILFDLLTYHNDSAGDTDISDNFYWINDNINNFGPNFSKSVKS